MKTLIFNKAILVDDGKSIVITADIVDTPFDGMLTTRVTHGHINPANMKHPRHIQSSNSALFIRHARHSVAMTNDFLVSVAAVVEPKTSFPPMIVEGKDPLSVELASESPVFYQWQVSDNAFPTGTFPPPAAVWTDIAGQVSATLDKSSVKTGQWVQCVVTNSSGKSTGKPFQIT